MNTNIFLNKMSLNKISLRQIVNRTIRCTECELLDNNGICTRLDLLYSLVDDKNCPIEIILGEL